LVVPDKVVLEARVDPIGEHLQLRLAALDAIAPAGMRGDGNEVEVSCAERTHVRRTPERLLRQILRCVLGPRSIDFGCQPIAGDGAAVIEKRRALAIAAGIVDPVGIDDVPAWAQESNYAAEIRQIITQLDDRNQVKLTQDF